MRPDAFGQRDAGGDGIDVDAVRTELVGELAGEGDDAALGRGVGARTVGAEPPPGDRGQVDDLAAAAPLHHRDHGMGEQERAVEVEGDQLLPVGETELLGRGLRIVDHRAAADGVDQDVDATVIALDLSDQPVDRAGVQRVDQPAFYLAARLAAGLAQRRHRLVQPALMVVDGDHRRTLARHDRCGGPADAVRRRADQRHLVLEAHGFLSPWSSFLVGPIVWLGAGESITAAID